MLNLEVKIPSISVGIFIRIKNVNYTKVSYFFQTQQKSVDKPAIEENAFDALERDFQEVCPSILTRPIKVSFERLCTLSFHHHIIVFILLHIMLSPGAHRADGRQVSGEVQSRV